MAPKWNGTLGLDAIDVDSEPKDDEEDLADSSLELQIVAMQPAVHRSPVSCPRTINAAHTEISQPDAIIIDEAYEGTIQVLPLSGYPDVGSRRSKEMCAPGDALNLDNSTLPLGHGEVQFRQPSLRRRTYTQLAPTSSQLDVLHARAKLKYLDEVLRDGFPPSSPVLATISSLKVHIRRMEHRRRTQVPILLGQLGLCAHSVTAMVDPAVKGLFSPLAEETLEQIWQRMESRNSPYMNALECLLAARQTDQAECGRAIGESADILDADPEDDQEAGPNLKAATNRLCEQRSPSNKPVFVPPEELRVYTIGGYRLAEDQIYHGEEARAANSRPKRGRLAQSFVSRTSPSSTELAELQLLRGEDDVEMKRRAARMAGTGVTTRSGRVVGAHGREPKTAPFYDLHVIQSSESETSPQKMKNGTSGSTRRAAFPTNDGDVIMVNDCEWPPPSRSYRDGVTVSGPTFVEQGSSGHCSDDSIASNSSEELNKIRREGRHARQNRDELTGKESSRGEGIVAGRESRAPTVAAASEDPICISDSEPTVKSVASGSRRRREKESRKPDYREHEKETHAELHWTRAAVFRPNHPNRTPAMAASSKMPGVSNLSQFVGAPRTIRDSLPGSPHAGDRTSSTPSIAAEAKIVNRMKSRGKVGGLPAAQRRLTQRGKCTNCPAVGPGYLNEKCQSCHNGFWIEEKQTEIANVDEIVDDDDDQQNSPFRRSHKIV
ncbi:hypothetical protein DFJ73DRAFT_864283 [Zopfochytrium polystomum]|nr:hypothetical protein DFJ73DRAFT_882205 [Zopfochytrium polystomum]KAI9327190.1 hypothetical protein DFJ73DRAFT_864283 [Zopfochytrium polystomum]